MIPRYERRRHWRRSWASWLAAPTVQPGPPSWWDLVPAVLVVVGALLLVVAAVLASGCGAAGNKTWSWAAAAVRCVDALALVAAAGDAGGAAVPGGDWEGWDLVEGVRPVADAGADGGSR